MTEIRSIVCPVDFSPGSSHATEYAAGLAKTLNAKLLLLHVYPLTTYVGPDGGMIITPDVAAQLSDQSQKALNRVCDHLKERGIHVEPHVRDGSPLDEITEFAEQNKADLIVMGTHGRGGLSRLLLGSVTERVVRTSKIPVLTVRIPEKESK